MPVPTTQQIDTYADTPAHVAAAIEGLSAAQLHYIPAIGEWSIHEIVIHLGDSEAEGFTRLRRALAEKGATLLAYDEEGWARNLSYRIQDRTLALQLFAALRASNTALLRLLPEDAWTRIGTHTERGELNVYDIFMTYLEHGTIHLQQIEQLKRTFMTKA